MVRHGLGRLTALVVAASVAVLLVPGLVSAHSELVSSSPASGATVPSPYTGPIVLTFSEHLATGSKADLVDPTGATVASATVDANAMTMTFTLASPLTPGDYQVKWVSIADDGDVLRQPIVTFTVAANASPADSASAAASAGPSATAATTTAPSAAPTPAPSPDPNATGNGSDVVIPIIVALIVLGAGAAYLLTRRNRPTDTP
jgi:methionine-rich copper-binding protein CopC